MSPEPLVLQIGALPDLAATELSQRFTLVACSDEREALARSASLTAVRGVATTGKAAIGGDLIRALAALEIISCLGAGTDGIDVAAAREKGVSLATTSRVLAADVADIAMGLIITRARNLTKAETFLRAGDWVRGAHRLGNSLQGARLGIVGLGAIGVALAKRAAAFDMEVAYHSRNAAPVPYPYVKELRDLALWSDYLALCCPGGAETRHLVNRQVLEALGVNGVLINVSRGSVVDEAALAEALVGGTIAGAGLDVFELEPNPHPLLFQSPNVTLLPHIGSATSQTRLKMAKAMVEALAQRLLGRDQRLVTSRQ